jgi:hypothetical protein
MAQLENKNKHVEPLQAKASSVDESMATTTSALSLDGNSRARRRTRRNEEKDPNKDPATKNLDGTAQVEGAETTNTFQCKFHPGDVVSMDEGVGVGVKKVNISIFLHRITKASFVIPVCTYQTHSTGHVAANPYPQNPAAAPIPTTHRRPLSTPSDSNTNTTTHQLTFRPSTATAIAITNSGPNPPFAQPWPSTAKWAHP